ncbi:lumenal Hsp70 protein [Microbotryomycetes sp. JL201]|nr:lumenal Hsp70 protein [Microbotryomycetes sp. JL201]
MSKQYSGPLSSKKKTELVEIVQEMGLHVPVGGLKFDLEDTIKDALRADSALRVDKRFEGLWHDLSANARQAVEAIGERVNYDDVPSSPVRAAKDVVADVSSQALALATPTNGRLTRSASRLSLAVRKSSTNLKHAAVNAERQAEQAVRHVQLGLSEPWRLITSLVLAELGYLAFVAVPWQPTTYGPHKWLTRSPTPAFHVLQPDLSVLVHPTFRGALFKWTTLTVLIPLVLSVVLAFPHAQASSSIRRSRPSAARSRHLKPYPANPMSFAIARLAISILTGYVFAGPGSTSLKWGFEAVAGYRGLQVVGSAATVLLLAYTFGPECFHPTMRLRRGTSADQRAIQWLFCVLIAVTLADRVVGAALLAIDYGADSFKASLVKPGVPFDVLVTKEGRRKTPSTLTMRGDDRAFGGESVNLPSTKMNDHIDDDESPLQATRFPQDTFNSVKLVLGHPHSHPQSQLYQSLFATKLSTTARESPALSTSSASFSVEEVLAMQLQHAKEVAEEQAGETVRDVVMTVPAWFSHSERMAVLDAIELAGLNNVALVNDGTAAAVNFAMSRQFPPEPTHHLFYDLGASSLRATVVSFKSAMLPDLYSLAAKPDLKNVTSMTVHGVGYDVQVGGFVLDKVVRDLMIDAAEAQGMTGLRDNKRAMAKLLKEAVRVKQVLSANTEAMARIEGLVEDNDFRAPVTRQQLEEGSADLLQRFTQPIQDALSQANLTVNNIESVVLVGGSSRVPMVQAAVASVVGEERIAKNVNADEANVLGAALYGAGLTRGFRTKDIRVKDINLFGIDVSYEADKITEDSEARSITTHLFPAQSKLGVKKTMTIKKTRDFSLHFAYRRSAADVSALLPDSIMETSFTGLTGAFENMTADAIANSTVTVTIELDESNIIKVGKAVIKTTVESDNNSNGSLNDKLKGFLGKFGSKDKTKDSSSDDGATDGDFDADDYDKETQDKLDELLKEASALKPKNSTVTLDAKVVMLERMPMSFDEKLEGRKRLREIKAAEVRKVQREEARNGLESYIYKVRDLVEDATFGRVSLEHERKMIREKVEAANEWLWDEADKALTKELRAKKNEIEKLVKLIQTRAEEARARPSLIESLRDSLSQATQFHTSATHNDTLTELKRFTAAELDKLYKIVKDSTEWLNDLVKKQDALKETDDPILRVNDLEKRIKEVGNEVRRLSKKKVPRKVKSRETTSATTTSDDEKSQETPKAEDGEPRVKDEL